MRHALKISFVRNNTVLCQNLAMNNLIIQFDYKKDVPPFNLDETLNEVITKVVFTPISRFSKKEERTYFFC